MSIRQDYSDWAASYDTDRNLTRDLDAQITRESLGKFACHTLLEIGCGTGKNTLFYREIADRVLALDFSEGMIAQARAKVGEGVGFAAADLTAPWPCAPHRVGLVACNLVLEHIADLGFVFGQAAHVLKSGGHFFISELHPFKQYQGKKAYFQREGSQVEIDRYVHHISDFTNAAQGFTLKRLGEWWHASDGERPPRLVTFLFQEGS